MNDDWKDYEPAPLEHVHGAIMDNFHDYRKKNSKDTKVEITGLEMNEFISLAKVEAYKKYPKHILPKNAILKIRMEDPHIDVDFKPKENPFWMVTTIYSKFKFIDRIRILFGRELSTRVTLHLDRECEVYDSLTITSVDVKPFFKRKEKIMGMTDSPDMTMKDFNKQ